MTIQTLKSTSLTYSRLVAPAGQNRFRFNFKVTSECGQHVIPPALLIIDPEHEDSYSQKAFTADSVQNFTGVPNPCVSFPAPPCLTIYYFHADTTLALNRFGYFAGTFDCCRPPYTNFYMDSGGIFRYPTPALSAGYSPRCTPDAGYGEADNGAAAIIRIPNFTDLPVNSSPQFLGQDTVLSVCKDSSFVNTIVVTEPDGDSLAFHIGAPQTFGLTWNCHSGCVYKIQTGPPYPTIYYHSPDYSIEHPFGNDNVANLDPHTGVFNGTIHDTGTYLLMVSVCEYRGGILLDSVCEDIMIRVYDCSKLNVHAKAGFPTPMSECSGFTAYFPNTTQPDYDNYNQSRNFTWDFGDGGTSTTVDPTHTYADTGTYTVRLIVWPGLSCADTARGKMIVYPYVLPDFSWTDSCSDQPMLFTNESTSTSGPITRSTWKVLLIDSVVDSAAGINFTYSFSRAPQTYGVVLTAFNAEGCMTSDTQYVDIYKSPLPLPFHDTTLARGEPLQLHANDGDGDGNANGRFLWLPSRGMSDPTGADPVLTGSVAGTYTVDITNTWGCQLRDTFHVTYYAGPNIYLPRAFTPNGDGRNDIFRPLSVGIAGPIAFRVFNRNGMLMYDGSRSEQGWDGMENGRPAPVGTYVWEASGTDYTGKKVFRQGTMQLIR